MAFESLTNDKIADLLNCPKRITNPTARKLYKCGNEQMNFKASASDGSGNEFIIFKRQNLREGMEDDFSCGIIWLAPNGKSLTLKRYNGPSHNHLNYLEKIRLGYVCHIHFATEKYIRAARKPEGFAEISKRYKTLEGALDCLIIDCKISNLSTSSEITNQIDLFNQ